MPQCLSHQRALSSWLKERYLFLRESLIYANRSGEAFWQRAGVKRKYMMECYLRWPLTESFFFSVISQHSRHACWDTLSLLAVKGKEGYGRLQLAESSPVHRRIRGWPPYCIVLQQKGMRLCWMEKTDCLLKSLTCRSPHSAHKFTHTPNIYTDAQAF